MKNSPSTVRRELARLGAPHGEVAVESITPMLAEARRQAFSADGWIFEMKYDGYRLLAGGSAPRGGAAGGALLTFRSGRNATTSFPVLARAVAALPFARLVIDGEVVALDAAGRPSFGLLQRSIRPAAAGRPAAPLVYFVFDLLACEGYDLRPLPLAARRTMLEKVIAAADPAGPLRRAEAVAGRGEDLFAAVAALGLEGIVAKRAASPYRSGRSSDWLKIRAEQVDDFVIVGYGLAAPPRAGAAAPDLRRLHLAVRQGGGFRYVGSVGSGLAAGLRDQLAASLGAIPAPVSAVRAGGGHGGGAQSASAAGNTVSARAREEKTVWLQGAPRADRRTVWIEPRLVCEVRYQELTAGGNLRQPVFLRLRDDKRPEECTGPEPVEGETP